MPRDQGRSTDVSLKRSISNTSVHGTVVLGRETSGHKKVKAVKEPAWWLPYLVAEQLRTNFPKDATEEDMVDMYTLACSSMYTAGWGQRNRAALDDYNGELTLRDETAMCHNREHC